MRRGEGQMMNMAAMALFGFMVVVNLFDQMDEATAAKAAADSAVK